MSKSHRPSLAAPCASSRRSSSLCRRCSMRSFSRPVASELPSSFSSNCRFTSQAPRGSALARPRMPAGWPSTRKRDQQHRTDGELGEALGLDQLVLARRGGVADLGEPQVFEAALQPRIGFQRRGAPGFHPALRQGAVGGVDLVDGRSVGREQPHEGGVHAGGIAQGVQTVVDAGIDAIRGGCSAGRRRSWCRRCRRPASACRHAPTRRPSRRRRTRSDHQDVQVVEPLFSLPWSVAIWTLRL